MKPTPTKSADVNFPHIAFLYSSGLNQSEIAKYLHISKTTVNTALKQKNLSWNVNRLNHQIDFLTFINEHLQNDKRKLRRLLLLESVLLILTSIIYAIL